MSGEWCSNCSWSGPISSSAGVLNSSSSCPTGVRNLCSNCSSSGPLSSANMINSSSVLNEQKWCSNCSSTVPLPARGCHDSSSSCSTGVRSLSSNCSSSGSISSSSTAENSSSACPTGIQTLVSPEIGPSCSVHVEQPLSPDPVSFLCSHISESLYISSVRM